MDRITPDCTPFILFLLIDDRVSPLEVIGELKQRVIFVRDVLAVNGLLDDFTAPIVVKPGLSHDLLRCRRFQKGVGSARNIEIDLRGISDPPLCEMHSFPTL